MSNLKSWSLTLAVLVVVALGTATGWDTYRGKVERSRADVEAVQDHLLCYRLTGLPPANVSALIKNQFTELVNPVLESEVEIFESTRTLCVPTSKQQVRKLEAD